MVLRRILGSSRDLLLRAFDGSFGSADWRPLLDFVSPSFFEVVSMGDLLSQGRELVANATDSRGRDEVRAEVARAIEDARLELDLVRDLDDGSPGEDESAGEPAQRVLELFFAQLFGAEASLIDLRQGAFSADATRWSPSSYYVRWEPEFLHAMRAMYAGFYDGADAEFAAGLRGLGLEGSRDLFERHFGADPENVTFDGAHFVSTFHDVFVRCRDQGVRLHRNFLPLGIYLAALHDHLARRGGGPFQVRSAFERATRPLRSGEPGP